MSISDNYAPDVNVCNGVTTSFTGDWKVLNASYFRFAIEDIATGVQTLLTQGTDYTLTFGETGYEAVTSVAYSASYKAVRYREVALDQTDPYRTSKGFQGKVIENSFDKLTAIEQDQNDQIGRSFKAPVGEGAVAAIPSASSRALKYLAFDALGNPIASDGTTDTPISAAMTPFVSADTLAEARTELGLGTMAAEDATAYTPIGTTIKSVKTQVFNSSGTYTPSTGMVSCIVRASGGGGGGGGVNANNTAASAGGGGGFVEVLLTAAQIGASQSVTIGAFGSGGTPSGGASGGDTSLGSLLSALGGAGGGAGSSGGQAGGNGGSFSVTTGTQILGIAGGDGSYSFASTGMVFCGHSGSNPMGFATPFRAVSGVSAAGVSGKGYGCGGGGAIRGTSGSTENGGNGSQGRIVIIEFCTQ